MVNISKVAEIPNCPGINKTNSTGEDEDEANNANQFRCGARRPTCMGFRKILPLTLIHSIGKSKWQYVLHLGD